MAEQDAEREEEQQHCEQQHGHGPHKGPTHSTRRGNGVQH